MAAFLLVTLALTRKPIQAVQHLTRAAQQIADGNFYTPLQSTEKGEVGDLATALALMRTQLLANIEALANMNGTLEARVIDQTQDLRHQQALTRRLLQRAITAQEEERVRVAREMHDEVGQALTAVKLSLERLAAVIPIEEEGIHKRLQHVQTLTEDSIRDLRRIITALRPGVLDQLGLVPALQWMSDHNLRPLGLQITIEADDLPSRLPAELETVLFRIAQEAMSNVARHSQASKLTIHLAYETEQVFLTLTDNGLGYDPSSLDLALDFSRGLGIAGMKERASLAGGQVTVESAPGEGTIVHVVIPISQTNIQKKSLSEMLDPPDHLPRSEVHAID